MHARRSCLTPARIPHGGREETKPSTEKSKQPGVSAGESTAAALQRAGSGVVPGEDEPPRQESTSAARRRE